VLFPLAGALFYAGFQTLTARLSALENPITTHFYTGLLGTTLLSLLLFGGPFQAISTLAAAPAWQWGLLALTGLLGTSGHLFLIFALGFAPTGTLMPFVYVQIAVAAAIGWFVFGHAPDAYAWLGMAVLSASGALAAWLNVREAQARNSVVLQDTIED